MIRYLQVAGDRAAEIPTTFRTAPHTRSPVTVVVISSNGKGDRPVESLEVKAPAGRETGQVRTGGPATWQAVAVANRSSPEIRAPRETDCGISGVPSPLVHGEGQCRRRCSGLKRRSNSPGSERAACQDGMGSESPEPLGGRLGAPAQRRHRV